jgi:hypothetical protein
MPVPYMSGLRVNRDLTRKASLLVDLAAISVFQSPDRKRRSSAASLWAASGLIHADFAIVSPWR